MSGPFCNNITCRLDSEGEVSAIDALARDVGEIEKPAQPLGTAWAASGAHLGARLLALGALVGHQGYEVVFLYSNQKRLHAKIWAGSANTFPFSVLPTVVVADEQVIAFVHHLSVLMWADGRHRYRLPTQQRETLLR